ncbi:MAG: polysaccharide biosynthesis protein [Clostridia bacterium]|nr:polysaccharide biosynthesis protein [Clostridia bacterium]
MAKKSFLKGAFILAAAGIISKIIGVAFRIPLANILGGEGIGLYQMAYPFYVALLMLNISGLPTAIAKLVSENIALNKNREAHRVFKVSFKLLTLLGLIGSVLLIGIIAPLYCIYIGSWKPLYPIMGMGPALFFVSTMSAYRGYFQGMQIMTPTAISQITEQIGKVIFGLLLAYIMLPKGPEFGATGAVIGIIISEFLALVVLIIIYNKKRNEIYKNINKNDRTSYREETKTIIYNLLKIAIPITLGGAIMPLVNIIDLMVIPKRLLSIGYSQKTATTLYGFLTGYANTLINFPPVFTIALGVSLVPAISEANVLKDYDSLQDRTEKGTRIAVLFAIPAALGLFVLAEPILTLLYSRAFEIEKAVENPLLINTKLLKYLSLGVIFLCIAQTLTAILQGVGKVLNPVKNLAVGGAAKIIINYILVGIPSLNINGAAIGTVVCYFVYALLNFIDVAKSINIKFNLVNLIIKPLISAFIMTLGVIYSYKLFFNTLNSNTMATILSIVIGIIIYILLLPIIGAITREDFEFMPQGDKLLKLFNSIGLLKK